MQNDDYLSRLSSDSDIEKSMALSELSAQAKAGYRLSQELVETLLKLTSYSGDPTHPDWCEEGAEEIRRSAVGCLGIFFKIKEAFPALKAILMAGKDTAYVLEAVIRSIGVFGHFPDLNKEVLRTLAQFALDQTNAMSLRQTACKEALFVAGRLTLQEWASLGYGRSLPPIDEAWLKSLM